MNPHRREFESQMRTAMAWFVGAVFFAFLGLTIATSQVLAFLVVLAVGYAVGWPVHARIGLVVGTATFGSSLLVPFLPGRLLVWEAATALAWSGLPFLFALRRLHPDSGSVFRRNRLLILLPFAYCLVLAFLMQKHGVSSGNFGSNGAGLRRYAQQIVCAILPLLYAALIPGEKTLLRLFLIQALLSVTYVAAELAFNFGQGDVRYLLYFMDLTNDSVGFAVSAVSGGFRRFQSLYNLSVSLSGLVLALVPIREWFSFRRFWAIPLLAAVVGVGLLSGHRYVLYSVGVLILGAAWTQRFFTFARTLAAFVVTGSAVGLAYALAPGLPDSAQRALTLLPGIEVRPHVMMDAISTVEGRREILRVGLDMIPDHLWVGRGFGMTQESLDMLARGVQQGEQDAFYGGMGVFYNGLFGLMVNTGIAGTAIMVTFILLGGMLALRVISLLRRHRWDDLFSRIAGVFAAQYLGNAVSTLFLHGDAEAITRVFGAQVGLLLAVECHLRVRLGPPGTSRPIGIQAEGPSASPAGGDSGIRAPQVGPIPVANATRIDPQADERSAESPEGPSDGARAVASDFGTDCRQESPDSVTAVARRGSFPIG